MPSADGKHPSLSSSFGQLHLVCPPRCGSLSRAGLLMPSAYCRCTLPTLSRCSFPHLDYGIYCSWRSLPVKVPTRVQTGYIGCIAPHSQPIRESPRPASTDTRCGPPGPKHVQKMACLYPNLCTTRSQGQLFPFVSNQYSRGHARTSARPRAMASPSC